MEQRLAALLAQSRYAVFFGGAGVSAPSGIPDFRSRDGLYNKAWAYPPEEILSRGFFMAQPEEFYRFYRARMLYPQARPNAAHRALARLEREGRLKAVVTQNIDGLHQAAGSREVVELHGSVHRNRCMACGRAFSLEEVMAQTGVPRCPCGGMVKPEVVLYEEPLEEAVIARALGHIRRADLLIIGGTSLAVYPAAGFVGAFAGQALVVINQAPTPQDSRASLVLRGDIAALMAC